MSDLSEAAGALVNGPESRHVVAALEALLDGDRDAARHALDHGAEISSWAAVTHRLDVAGRALAADDPAPPPPPVGEVGAEAAATVFDAWVRGEGLPVSIDLTSDHADPGSSADRAWAGLGVLAALVDRSGFPPQVVV